MKTNERLREIDETLANAGAWSNTALAFQYCSDVPWLRARLDEVVKLAREFADCKWRDLYQAETELRRCLAELEKGE